MLRIWLTEYDLINKVTGLKYGDEAGPNIPGPSAALALQIAKCTHPHLKLRVLGPLITSIPTKIDIDNPDRETFDPDWANAIHYDIIMYN